MKKGFIILVSVIILVILALSVFYCIDMNRIKNNEAVLFSTWGYEYTPPEKDTPLKAFERIENGTKRSEIIKSFGEPDGQLSGLWGDIYLVENKRIIILYEGNDLDDAVVDGIKFIDIDSKGETESREDKSIEIADKTYVYEKGAFGGVENDKFYIKLNADGTFEYYEGMLSSYIGTKDNCFWTYEGNTLILTDKTIENSERVNYFKVDERGLIFQADKSSNFIYVKVEDGDRFNEVVR